MVVFKSNVPQFFTVAEITQFNDWLDELEQPHLPHSHYYVARSAQRIVACGGFGFDPDTSEVTLAWGMVDKAFHKIGRAHV